MKKVVLVTNSLFEYRYLVYNEFLKLFKENGYFFKIVIINDNKRKIIKTETPDYINIDGGYRVLKKTLDNECPNVIISFIAPTNRFLWLLFFYSKLRKIPNITWTHGINLQDPKNKIKRAVYNAIHKFSSALILYSKNELKFLKKKYHQKAFIANNTISLNSIPEIVSSKDDIKRGLNIQFDKIVLFVGRMQKRKRIEVLIDIFKDSKFQQYGLLIVGPGFDKYYEQLIENQNNIKYMGAIFDSVKVNEIFKISDLFCIPGTNGLGINQAMYWGLPCLALNVYHSPEVIYLENNETGYIVGNPDDLSDKLYYLLENDHERKRISKNATEKIKREASIDKMFEGFIGAINFVE